MNAIEWPREYLPDLTDNFVSNEVIVAGLSAGEVWPLLSNATLSRSYYANSAKIRFHDGKGPELERGARLDFETFGSPAEAEVVEYQPPTSAVSGRVDRHEWAGEGEKRPDVHHAWLVKDLAGNRVRVLTQETQIGKSAQKPAEVRPNAMLNGHRDWLRGLVAAAHQVAGKVA